MLVSASGSTSGLPADVLHSCCPSAADDGRADFRTREADTVGVVDVASPMMMVPSGTTSLTPWVWLSACASAAGIVAATALRSERVVMCVALTCFSWATSGACSGRGGCLPCLPVGLGRGEAGELVVEHDHHATLACRTRGL